MAVFSLIAAPEGFKALDLPSGQSYAENNCLRWVGEPKAANWKTPTLTWVEDDLTEGGEVDADFVKFLGGPPVLSQKAYAELHEFLQPFGEFLPVVVDGETRYILNVTTVLDLMDTAKSKYKIHQDGRVGACEHAYLNEAPADQHIFKVKGYLPRTFISEALKSKIESLNLSGTLARKHINP